MAWAWGWEILKGRRFNPWQHNLKNFTISTYRWFFNKPNMGFGKSYPSTDSCVSKLHLQIFKLHMHFVQGPASQDAFIRRVYALPDLQWGSLLGSWGEPPCLQDEPPQVKADGDHPCLQGEIPWRQGWVFITTGSVSMALGGASMVMVEPL